MTIIGKGQLSLLDLNDAIIAGTAPTNPSEGTLWIDSSVNPNILKKWNGSAWVEQPLDLTTLDPDFTEAISTGVSTALAGLGNLSSDDKVTASERQVIADKLTEILGTLPAGTTALPAVATVNTYTNGEYYQARKAATDAGVSTSDSTYTALATAYTTLQTYLNGIVETGSYLWDVSEAAKDKVHTIVGTTFRSNWQTFYNALLNLRTRTAKRTAEAKTEAEVYAKSYRSQLVANGYADLGWNRNFSGFSYNGTEKVTGPGSFLRTTAGETRTDEFIKVEGARTYRMSLSVKSSTTSNTHNIGIECYNAAGTSLGKRHIIRTSAGSTTIPSTTGWIRYEGVIGGLNTVAGAVGDSTFPAGTTQVKIWFNINVGGAANSFYVADVSFALEQIEANKDYNGISMSADKGLVVESSRNTTTMSATKGIEIKRKSDNANVFSVDANTGDLNITGNITMTGGVISWDNLNKPTAAQVGAATSTDITNAVKAIQIGGRNLLPNSNTFQIHGSATGITPTVLSDGSLQVVSTADNGNYLSFMPVGGYGNLEQSMLEGEEFTVSMELKSADNTKPPSLYLKPDMGYFPFIGSVRPEFSQVYFTQKWKKANGLSFHLGFSGIVGTTIIKNIKIEKGNKATDWTPAPEDTQSQLDNFKTLTDGWKAPGTTEISGTAIKTGTFDAGKITTGTLNASLVSVINLNAANIQTGTLDASKVTIIKLDASQITTGRLRADRIAIGDFTNLVQYNELSSGIPYSVVTHTDSKKYIKSGAGSYSGIRLSVSEKVEFVPGDKYFLKLRGFKDAGLASVLLIARYYYSDGTSENAGSVSVPFTATSSVIETVLNIVREPTQSKTIKTVEFFLEKDNSTTNTYSVREMELRKMMSGNLLVDGTIDASKVSISADGGNVVVNGAGITARRGSTVVSMNSGAGFKITNSGQDVFRVEADGMIYAKGLTTLAEFRSLEVGGRNLLRNTEFNMTVDPETETETLEHWQGSNLVRREADFKNMNTLETSRTNYVEGDARSFLTASADSLPKKAGQKFSVSLWYYVDSRVPLGGSSNNIYVRLFKPGGTMYTDFEITNYTSAAKDRWIYVSQSFELLEEYIDSVDNVFAIAFQQNGRIKISMPQLETGSLATSWSPAPEDTSRSIAGIIGSISTIKQSITQDGITSMVLGAKSFGDVMNTKADASALADYASTQSLEDAKKQLQDYADGKISEINLTSYVSKSELDQTANNFDFKLTRAGGVNLLQNSVGWANDFNWTTGGSTSLEVIKGTSELIGLGAGAAWKLNGKSIEQSVPVVSGEDYTFQMLVKKEATEPGGYLDVDEGDGTLSEKLVYLTSQAYEWAAFTYSFKAKGANIRIRIRGVNTSPTLITNVMLNKGPLPMQWTHAKNEIHNSNVRFDLGGIVVQNSATNGETRITPEEFAGYSTNELGEQEKIFTLNGDTTEVKKLKASEQFSMGLIRILQVEEGTTKGWAFLPNE